MVLVLPFPVIDPILAEIGPIAIRWYSLAYIVGILAGWGLARRQLNRPALWGGQSPPPVAILDDSIIWIVLGIVLGGRIGYVLFYDFGYFVQNPGFIFTLWHGGMSFHGGFLGFVISLALFARRRALPFWSLLDLFAIFAPIGLFLGRIANFINGELWGRPSDVPWAMIFPNADSQPRHPSQLYEAVLEGLLIFIVLWIGHRRWKILALPGLASGCFCLLYGIARLIAETFRMPDPQLGFLFGPLTMGMLLSLPLIAIGIYLIRRAFASRAVK